jgi:glyoxylate reductase
MAVARRAKAFGLSINYHNRHRMAESIEQELGATYGGKASTRCWPTWTSSRSTAHRRRRPSISCRRAGSSSCKPTAYIVNTSRGDVIDEGADPPDRGGKDRRRRSRCLRARSLRQPAPARAGPQGQGRLSPHMSSATIEGRIEMGEKVIINIKTFSDGHKPPDRVVPAML